MPLGSSKIRWGNVADLYALQHELGYAIYRVNVHTNREILDWKGVNVNQHSMSPHQPQFVSMRNLRGVRVLEYLLPTTPREQYDTLLRYGQSLLITRVQLGQYTKHHVIDLAMSPDARLSQAALNEGLTPTPSGV
jgi:hypothetical protein